METIKIKNHDYMLDLFPSKNGYVFSILPDYDIWEDGDGFEIAGTVFDYEDEYRLEWKYLRYSGKRTVKTKVLESDSEIISKDDFDFEKDSCFVAMCEHFDKKWGKETFNESRKLIKESADDNWYKLKMLNEMLDAMEEDEYNIPKLGIYGVTKNINLDEGAIEALINYYK